MLILLAFGALLVIRGRFVYVDSLRLAIYGLPLAIGSLLFVRVAVRPIRLFRPIHATYFRPQILLYLALIAASSVVLAFRGAHLRFLQEAVFVLAPLALAALFFVTVPDRGLHERCAYVLALVLVGVYILVKTPRLEAIFDVFRWDVFLASSLDTESALAYEFGMISVYFAARRKALISVIAGFFLLLSYKRIAVVASLIALLTFWVASFVWRNGTRSRQGLAAIAVIVNLILVVGCLQFATGRYDHMIEDAFGISANDLTMGRRHIHSQVLAGLDIPHDAFGLAATMKGLGSSHDYLVSARSPIENMHSDLMKGLVEFGFLGFIAWIYVFYRVNSFSPIALALAVYWNVLWLTDDTFIYFDVAFVFYTLVGLAFVARDPVLPRAPG